MENKDNEEVLVTPEHRSDWSSSLTCSRCLASPDALSPEARVGWKNLGRAPSDHLIELHFLLKQRNVDKLESELLAVSDPTNPRYGQHLSNAAVHALVAPSATAIAAVRSPLISHGLNDINNATENGDMIAARMTVETAEVVLGCRYHIYRREEDGIEVTRTASYSLPPAVAAHVARTPTVQMPSRRAQSLAEEVKTPEGSSSGYTGQRRAGLRM